MLRVLVFSGWQVRWIVVPVANGLLCAFRPIVVGSLFEALVDAGVDEDEFGIGPLVRFDLLDGRAAVDDPRVDILIEDPADGRRPCGERDRAERFDGSVRDAAAERLGDPVEIDLHLVFGRMLVHVGGLARCGAGLLPHES